MIYIFACNELSVIKTNTVIEEQFDIIRYQLFAVFVDGVL